MTSPRQLHWPTSRGLSSQEITADGKNVVPDVWEVLDQIKEFSDRVRSGEWRGATGQRITNFVAIGIGGSFLGPLFVHTALRTDQVTSRSRLRLIQCRPGYFAQMMSWQPISTGRRCGSAVEYTVGPTRNQAAPSM